MNSTLQELREMTERVLDFNPWAGESRRTYLECVRGKAETVAVYQDLNISVGKTTFEADTLSKKCCHPERKVIQVLEGELIFVLIENRKKRVVTLKQHQVLVVEPMIRHYCYNAVKTITIISLMPRSPFFPVNT